LDVIRFLRDIVKQAGACNMLWRKEEEFQKSAASLPGRVSMAEAVIPAAAPKNIGKMLQTAVA
jgi:hypothetical protein